MDILFLASTWSCSYFQWNRKYVSSAALRLHGRRLIAPWHGFHSLSLLFSSSCGPCQQNFKGQVRVGLVFLNKLLFFQDSKWQHKLISDYKRGKVFLIFWIMLLKHIHLGGKFQRVLKSVIYCSLSCFSFPWFSPLTLPQCL